MRPIKSLLILIFCSLILVVGVSQVAAQDKQTSAEKLASIGGYPCPDSDFTCLKGDCPSFVTLLPSIDPRHEVSFGVAAGK